MRIHRIRAAREEDMAVVRSQSARRAMSWIRDAGTLGGMVTACLFLLCGCGANEGAGTVNMASIKSAARERGLVEGKSPGGAKAGNGRSTGRTRRLSPGKPLAKSGR